MIPLSVMVTGKGTVSGRIKGRYGKGSPSRFTTILKPVVFWNITYQCNLYCEHCYIGAGPNPGKPELSPDDALRVAGEIVEHGIPLVVFTGGEPLISEKFWRVMEYFHSVGRPKTSVSTNGTLIDEANAERLARLGATYVGVSLDSLDPEVHDKFRGRRGAWRAAVNGMRNSVKAGIPTGLRVTVANWNMGELPAMIDFAAELGLERVSVYLLDTVGRGRELLGDLPAPQELAEMVDGLVEKAKQYEGRLEILLVRMNFAGIYLAGKLAKTREEFHEYLDLIEAQGDCGRKTVSIYPDGTVRPCQFIESFIIGDLKRQRLPEILTTENPMLRPFIDMASRLKGPRCSSCPYKHICGGGSRNRAYAHTGDFWGDDPACFVDYESVGSRWNG